MPPTVDRDRRRSTSLPRRRLGPSSTGGRRESARSSAVASASSPHGPPQRSRTRSPYEPVSGQTVRRRPSVPPTTEAEDVERNPTVPSAPSCDLPSSSYRPRIPRASLDARKKGESTNLRARARENRAGDENPSRNTHRRRLWRMPPSVPAAHVLAPVAAGVRPGLGQGYAGVRMGWLVRL